MYEPRQDIKHIQATREQIVAILESINQPMVAAMGRSAETAKAYIVGIRSQSSGLFSIYVYLYLVDAKECLIYLHDPPEIQMETYHDIEVESLAFVESMGFMVDNVNFRDMQPDQQEEYMDGIPVFQADLEAFARSQELSNEASAEDSEDSEDVEDAEVVDLSPLEDDFLELKEMAEPQEPVSVVTAEGLAKIMRMLSSF